MEQDLHKLEVKKKKKSKVEIAYIVEVESSDALNPHLLPLFGFFDFDSSFSILPDVIFDNMPVFFL